MTDRPIPFSAPMIRALLEDRKTMTRRILKPEPFIDKCGNLIAGRWNYGQTINGEPCFSNSAFKRDIVRYAAGDRLWVKEAWRAGAAFDGFKPSEIAPGNYIHYEADRRRNDLGRYRHSRFMPRWVSRLTLLVESVKVERLQDISEADALAEGALAEYGDGANIGNRRAFELIWRTLHGEDAWTANPYVAAITFRTVKSNIDALAAPAAEQSKASTGEETWA